jgi:exosome complex exonuclease DIS3/RRP44
MIDDTKNNEPLTLSIRGLMKIAVILRDRRMKMGALTLSSPELKFKLDANQNPTEVKEY